MLFVENEHNIKHKYINKKRQKRLMPECELFKLRYFKVDSNILYDVQFVFFYYREVCSWIVSNIIMYHHNIPFKQNMNKHIIIIIALHWWCLVCSRVNFYIFAEFSIKQIYQNENEICVKFSKVKHFFLDKLWKHFIKKSQHQLNATTKKWFNV